MAKGETSPPDEKLIVKNRRASFDYTIGDRYEGGLVLHGGEVKALRDGKVDLVDAFASVDDGEVWLKQLHVAAYEQAHAYPHIVRRPRKVLLHKKQIDEIARALDQKGFTMVPLRLYFKRGRVKVELALVRGKRTFDKRQDIAKKTAEHEARPAMARGRRGE
jgi:SsrA-binding protein